MRVVVGRGDRRTVYPLPCGNIMQRADKKEVAALHDNLVSLMKRSGVRFAPDWN